MQIHITIDGPQAEAMFDQFAMKHSVQLAQAMQRAAAAQQPAAAEQAEPVKTASEIIAEQPAEAPQPEDPLPPSDNVGAEKLTETAAQPEKKAVGRPKKEKAPEKPAEIGEAECREALKKVAAKAGKQAPEGQDPLVGGIGKVEELLAQFGAERVSALKPAQWNDFHAACMEFVNG